MKIFKVLSCFFVSIFAVCCGELEYGVDAIQSEELSCVNTENNDCVYPFAEAKAAELLGGGVCRVATNTTLYVSNSRSGADTLLQIVNFEDAMGFAVITNRSGKNELLILCEEGSFEDCQNAEGFAMCMAAAINYSSGLRDTTGRPPYTGDVDPEPIFRRNIELLDTLGYFHSKFPDLRWGQTWPEGWYAPNRVSGCVPTAIAICMAHLETPQSMCYTYANISSNYEEFNWPLIKTHTQSGDESLHCCDELIHQQIARICRQIGYSGNAIYEYSENGNVTGVRSQTVPSLARSLLEGCSVGGFEEFDASKALDVIRDGGLLLVEGRDPGLTGSHTWVITGAHYLYTHYRQYSVPPFNIDPTTGDLLDEVYSRDLYLYHNFGSNGKGNAYVNHVVLADKVPFNEGGTNLEFQNLRMIRITKSR